MTIQSLESISESKAQEISDLAPLNLVTTYPVRWSRYQVLRDFLQNFFDAVPNEEFAGRVEMQTSADSAELKVKDVPFSHEWLVAIGASSKTLNAEGDFAGYFGEGFKVAALCATRDYHWKVSAGSRNWRLKVVTTPLAIDGAALESLAYEIEHLSGSSGTTWLRLEGLSQEDQALFKTAVRWSFYYPENPLLGELLWSDRRTAIWTRSEKSLPDGYPAWSKGEGLLFVGRQVRGAHKLPFVIAAHDMRDSDRERSIYYDFQVIDSLARVSHRLPASVSMPLLEAVSAHWRDYRKRRYQCGTWEPVVRALAENVASDPKTASQWRELYPKLLVLEPMKGKSIRDRNRRSEAFSWLRSSGENWTLVQDAFSELGYPTLEEECLAQGGFLRRAQLTSEDRRRIEVLMTFVRNHLVDLLPLDPLPRVELVKAERAGWRGYATCRRLPKGPLSSGGRRVRYTLSEIALSHRDLLHAKPQRALATLLHELCHAFGSDRSRAFGDSLTDVLERLLELPSQLQALSIEWSNGR